MWTGNIAQIRFFVIYLGPNSLNLASKLTLVILADTKSSPELSLATNQSLYIKKKKRNERFDDFFFSQHSKKVCQEVFSKHFLIYFISSQPFIQSKKTIKYSIK